MLKKIVLHPALLLAAGNTALAFESAEIVAISLNILLVAVLLFSRSMEVARKKHYGVPFTILALVNFFTAASVIYTNSNLEQVQLLDYVAALAFISWGFGHILAGMYERNSSTAKHIVKNPQFYYGIGDMSAVNASGSINPFSFSFMILGFFKSFFIGKKTKSKNKFIKFAYSEFTSARIYGTGFIIGALTSLTLPYFVIAQLFWSLAYFQFKKDT